MPRVKSFSEVFASDQFIKPLRTEETKNHSCTQCIPLLNYKTSVICLPNYIWLFDNLIDLVADNVTSYDSYQYLCIGTEGRLGSNPESFCFHRICFCLEVLQILCIVKLWYQIQVIQYPNSIKIYSIDTKHLNNPVHLPKSTFEYFDEA